MSSLSYSVFTDAAPLEVSQAGAAVYLLVANHKKPNVNWSTIDVKVPTGAAASDLTTPEDSTSITTDVQQGPGAAQPDFGWDAGAGAFRATPAVGGATLRNGQFMVLVLENVSVNQAQGLAVLTVSETVRNTRNRNTTSSVPLGLLKKAPTAPRNFRPDRTEVGAGDEIVLSWDGPDELDYEIRVPDGPPVPVTPPSARSWSPAPGDGPKRGTTYTLVAKSGGQEKYSLTTTVQVRNPTFESITATNGVTTAFVQGLNSGDGDITFPPGGVKVWRTRSSGDGGTLYAQGVHTGWVQGENAGDGWISFPKTGLNVYRDGSQEWGNLRIHGVNTKWAQGENDGDGWISFSQVGLHVMRDGKMTWGNVLADMTDVHRVKTRWVQGQNATDGRITFSNGGLAVNENEDGYGWGVVAAKFARRD